LFEPPLPKGVPERLEKIVDAAHIGAGETVLDVGAGTGILIPLIQRYAPGRIYACDLSDAMLKQLNNNYNGVTTIRTDIRDLSLPAESVDVVFVNACYPNIADKPGAFKNISRMMRPAGRMIISHPLGKAFIESLRRRAPYPLDDFPSRTEARKMLGAHGLGIERFVDQPELYILSAVKECKKQRRRSGGNK
jgi:SAM-dependent methyltransferase